MGKDKRKPVRQRELAGRRFQWSPDDNKRRQNDEDEDEKRDDYTADDVATCRRNGHVDIAHGVTAVRIPIGTTIFLRRGGKDVDLRGIVGVGETLDEHHDNCITIRYRLLSLTPLVPQTVLDEPPFDNVSWACTNSAIKLKSVEQHDRLVQLADAAFQRIDQLRNDRG